MQNITRTPNTNYEFNRVVDLRVAKTDFNSPNVRESLLFSLYHYFHSNIQTIKWKIEHNNRAQVENRLTHNRIMCHSASKRWFRVGVRKFGFAKAVARKFWILQHDFDWMANAFGCVNVHFIHEHVRRTLTCIDPAAQLSAAFVRFRNMIGLRSSNFVTYKDIKRKNKMQMKYIYKLNDCMSRTKVLDDLIQIITYSVSEAILTRT